MALPTKQLSFKPGEIYPLCLHKLKPNCARTLPAMKMLGFKNFISCSNVFYKKVLFILLHQENE